MEEKQKTTFSWRIGGEAGYGANKTGLIFTRFCHRRGFYVYDHAEFPSLIRGGHTHYQVTVADHPIYATPEHNDLLVALDERTLREHGDGVAAHGTVIYDPVFHDDALKKLPATVTQIAVPLLEFAKKYGRSDLARNTVGLGASLAVMGLTLRGLDHELAATFGKKGAKVAAANLRAAQAGYDYVQKNFPQSKRAHVVPPRNRGPRMVVTGNEATAMGAIAAGCRFYTAYPMSPSSSILHYMVEKGPQHGVVVRQGEDEIGVINMALGASYAGARVQVGTSGGGFSLMTEGLGLAGITETPIVIVVASRPGPATGLPTWTQQADLAFVVHASQGEFPRVVIAPGDPEEMFYATMHAHNLAEKYQLPVIILSDKTLSEDHYSVPPFKPDRIPLERGKLLSPQEFANLKKYQRYALTPSGVSPRALPHYRGHVVLANSDEHDAEGYSEESAENRVAQDDKRWRKLATLQKEIPAPHRYGPEEAELSLIGWGSSKGAILDALDDLNRHHRVNFYHYQYVWPLPEEATHQIFASTHRVMSIEGNRTGQLSNLIRQQTGHQPHVQMAKYDGRPLWPEEVRENVLEYLRS